MSYFNAKCIKFDFGRGSAPDPVGGAYSAPPDLLAESYMHGLLFRGWKRTRREGREQDGRGENPKYVNKGRGREEKKEGREKVEL